MDAGWLAHGWNWLLPRAALFGDGFESGDTGRWSAAVE